MANVNAMKCDALRTWGEFQLLLPTAYGGDYSEEAIPERDPAYRLPVGTCSEDATIEFVSPERRRDLERRLQQLGMSPARAAAVACF